MAKIIIQSGIDLLTNPVNNHCLIFRLTFFNKKYQLQNALSVMQYPSVFIPDVERGFYRISTIYHT